MTPLAVRVDDTGATVDLTGKLTWDPAAKTETIGTKGTKCFDATLPIEAKQLDKIVEMIWRLAEIGKRWPITKRWENGATRLQPGSARPSWDDGAGSESMSLHPCRHLCYGSVRPDKVHVRGEAVSARECARPDLPFTTQWSDSHRTPS
jgi:hypothetical protein